MEENENVTGNENATEPFFYSESLYFANVSLSYSEQANVTSNTTIKDQLNFLAEAYASVSTTLTQLEQQINKLHESSGVIQVDSTRMVSHYVTAKDGMMEVLHNMANLTVELNDSRSNLSHLVDPALAHFTHVSSNIMERSLKALEANAGRCGHISYSYEIMTDVCFYIANK